MSLFPDNKLLNFDQILRADMNKIIAFLLFCFIVLSCNSNRNAIKPAEDGILKTSDSVQSTNSLKQPSINFYSDTIPCGGCDGIVYQLFLDTDNSYILSEEFLGKKEPAYVRFGSMDKTDSLITLYMPMGRKVKLRVTDTGMHMQDIKEAVEPGKKDYTLNPVPNGRFDFSMPYSMDGAYFYQASGATFTPCGQAVSYPVKPAKASFEAEKLFLNDRQKKGGPVYLRALVRISKEKDLAGMDQQMVWMDDLIIQLREAECNSNK